MTGYTIEIDEQATAMLLDFFFRPGELGTGTRAIPVVAAGVDTDNAAAFVAFAETRERMGRAPVDETLALDYIGLLACSLTAMVERAAAELRVWALQNSRRDLLTPLSELIGDALAEALLEANGSEPDPVVPRLRIVPPADPADDGPDAA